MSGRGNPRFWFLRKRLIVALEKFLLDIIVCPACKSTLIYNEQKQTLTCQNAECYLIYPIIENIPVLLIDKATKALV